MKTRKPLAKSYEWRVITCVLAFVFLCDFPLADRYTCNFPNGDMIKMRKVYGWSFFGAVLKSFIWHVNVNSTSDYNLATWYVNGKSKQKVDLEHHSDVSCRTYGLFGQVLNVNGSYLLLDDGKITQNKQVDYLDDILSTLDSKRGEDGIFMLKPEFYLTKLNYTDSFYGVDNNYIVYEVGLFYLNGVVLGADVGEVPERLNTPITAVWQSHSIDKGKTWSKPIITKEAKLFVLGKTLLEQPSIAKPGISVKYIGWF